MNWFQKLLNNPNAHLIGAIAAGAASKAFPAYSGALEIVAGTLVGTGYLTPEAPGQAVLPTPVAAPAPVITLPPAAAGGSYHKEDWASFAAAVIAQLAKPEQPGRS